MFERSSPSRLLAGQSFLVTYVGGDVKRVRFLAGADTTTLFAVPDPPAGIAADAVDEEPVAETGSLAASHRRIEIGGRLARALRSRGRAGTSRPPFGPNGCGF